MLRAQLGKGTALAKVVLRAQLGKSKGGAWYPPFQQLLSHLSLCDLICLAPCPGGRQGSVLGKGQCKATAEGPDRGGDLAKPTHQGYARLHSAHPPGRQTLTSPTLGWPFVCDKWTSRLPR